jgi:hypothetical protein
VNLLLFFPANARTDVGCCSEGYHKHRDIFRLPEDLKVGKCSWNYLGVGDDKVDAGVQPGGRPCSLLLCSVLSGQ